MSALPSRFASVILCFAGLFRQRTWHWAQELLVGALLTPGVRTVAGVLRVLGLAGERRFVNYHRVLSRAAWSPRAAARVLLRLLVSAFVPEGPIVLGIDDTIERRRGARIVARGIYRDPVRSSHSHFVKTSGLRWLSVMLLAPIPWAQRVWALPVLTALAPSERHDRKQGRRHKRLTDWARQMLLQLRRWLPGRSLVVVADSSFAALDLLNSLSPHMTCITRLRLDAQLYAPAPPRQRHARGRPRKKGARLPALSAVLADGETRWERRLVPRWSACPRDVSHRGRLGHGRVAPHGFGGTASALGAHSRPAGTLRRAGVAALSARDDSTRRRAVLRAVLAARGHLRGGAAPPRDRDAAPVVRAGHRSHDASVARLVLAGDAAGHEAGARRRLADAAGRLVPQDLAYLQRCLGRRAQAVVAHHWFIHLDVRARCRQSASPRLPTPARGGLLCRLMAKVKLSVLTLWIRDVGNGMR